MTDIPSAFLPVIDWLDRQPGVLVAYSGGVDSSLLAVLAHRTLGDRMRAVTAYSEIYPDEETRQAQRIAAELGLPFEAVRSHELDNPKFAENSLLRCYHCKQELFDRLFMLAEKYGLGVVADGQNADDAKDFRPGLKAGRERGIASPFLDLGITKQMIVDAARSLGLPNWDKPPHPCLSTRFAYGKGLTAEGLKRVESAEILLHGLGFSAFRLRVHDDVARLEIAPDDFPLMLDDKVRTAVVSAIKREGYAYVTLDLQGYRPGAMNEVLKKQAAERP